MKNGLFGVRFSVFEQENGAAAPIDFSSTFATAPFFYKSVSYRTSIHWLILSLSKINGVPARTAVPSPLWYASYVAAS